MAAGLKSNHRRIRRTSVGIPLSVYCMALGTFAIGTEGFMIAPLFPRMADDFGMPVSSLALLITVFTLTLALSSPVLTVLSARQNRRKVLLAALSGFAVANVFAWSSTSFDGILVARIILAATAGLYAPNAAALAGTIVAPDHRGRALAIVNSGTTIAIALGLPLGALVGNAFGWRMTFLAVGFMAIIAAIGIATGVASDAARGLAIAGLRERVAVAAKPQVFLTLVVTFLWAAGVYTAYPMLAPYLIDVAKLSGRGITAMVSLWGVSAATGVFIGGRLTDRVGSTKVIGVALALGTLAFVILAAVGFLSLDNPVIPVAVGMAFWGLSGWSFTSASMARLVQVGGVAAAPISMSLNYSIMYAGFGTGSAIGAKILASGSVAGIELSAAITVGLAFAYFMATKCIVDRGGR